MLNNGLRQWLHRVSQSQYGRPRARVRRRRLMIAAPAEILESRLLLSAATHLAFAPLPSTPQTAGTSFTVTVNVEDSSNNVVGTNHSLVTLTESGPGRFTTGHTSVSQSAIGGVATFTVTLDTAGTYTLTATDGSLRKAVDTGLAVTADTSDAEHLAFVNVPSTGTAGLPLKTFDVVVEDQFGNRDTTADHTDDNVVLSEAGPGARCRQPGERPHL